MENGLVFISKQTDSPVKEEMLLFKLNLIIFILATASSGVISEEKLETIEINIEDKHNITVIGTVNTTWDDKVFFSFRGLPYAQPPVAELRFRDPVSLDPLPQRIDGRYVGHDCPSIYATNASENCLFLNVYTQNISRHAQLPVLVFIPPGGFYIGSGLSTFLGPEQLLTQSLVLVTLNYRLGTLGFLNLGTESIPGNAGLKDQVLALRWVQRYIQNFGGDPSNVTLAGYSAGALSVGLHLVSPMSEGLYQKAIMMSGALPPQTQLPHGNQLNLARRQANVLNCSDAIETENILECLNRFDGITIAGTLRRMFDFGKDNPIYLWLPIIENDYGQERFLTEEFYESLLAGRFQKVPLLIGHVDGEFGASAAQILQDTQLQHTFYEHYEHFAPIIFMFQGHHNATEIANHLKSYYLPKDAAPPQLPEFDRLTDFFSDAIIRFGSLRTAEIASRYINIFTYKFIIRSDFSTLNYPVGNPRVEHIDDLTYLFRMPMHPIEEDEPDADIVRLYTAFMFDFIANGNLTLPMAKTFPKAYALLYGRTDIAFQSGLNFDDAEIWCSLFP